MVNIGQYRVFDNIVRPILPGSERSAETGCHTVKGVVVVVAVAIAVAIVVVAIVAVDIVGAIVV